MERQGLRNSRLDRLSQASAELSFLFAVTPVVEEQDKNQWQEVEQRGEIRVRHGNVPALWDFTIDHDIDPIHPRLDRLTHALQIAALRHGLAGLRETRDDHDGPCIGQLPGRHGAR